MGSCIYQIWSPIGKLYIGQTVNYYKRIKRYENLNCKLQVKLYNSFIKYGFENHIISILHFIPKNSDKNYINELEIYYIKYYKEIGIELLNMTSGGTGVRGVEWTEEKKKRLSKAKKDVKFTNETKQKMSSYHKNRPIAHSTNLIGCNYKKLYQYNLNFELIKIWESLKEATDIGYGDIRGCITGRQKTAGGYIWSYSKIENINEYIKNKLNKQPKHKTRVILDLNTGVYYNSCRELCELINIQYHTMYSKLKGYHTNNTQYIFA
jgi:group I intron endonuclease